MARTSLAALTIVTLTASLLAGCGTTPVSTATQAQDAQMDAKLGKVTFTAKLENAERLGGGYGLPAPYLVLTGTPKLGEPVVESYVDLMIKGKNYGARRLFLGTDGNLYVAKENDHSAGKWFAHPAGTTYYKAGTYRKPATMTQRMPITFEVNPGVRLERHRKFAGIYWSTWISMHIDKAVAVESPSLVNPASVK